MALFGAERRYRVDWRCPASGKKTGEKDGPAKNVVEIDQSENGGIGPDCEGRRDHRNGSKPR